MSSSSGTKRKTPEERREEELREIESRLSEVMPRWLARDEPDVAHRDYLRHKSRITSSTGQARFVRPTPEASATALGTDEVDALMRSIEAMERRLVMKGRKPQDEIQALLRRKLALLEEMAAL